MDAYIVAIDQGTTSTRCILFDHAGNAAASAQREHKQSFPQAGWVEHDAIEIWQNTQLVIHQALSSANVNAASIKAIGITNQRETTVVWNRRTGKPYHPAIVWQDTRTDQICAGLTDKIDTDQIRTLTGLPVATYFSGPKITWLLENVSELRADAEQGIALFGNMDSWLIWNLTGGINGGQHITDVSNASRTMLMNLATLQWHDDLLAAMQIPKQMMPNIRPSSDTHFYGRTTKEGVFNYEIPVCGDLGDQQAATVGQACFAPGDTKNTYGTGCFLIQNTGTELIRSKHGLISTACYQFNSEPVVYALEGSIAIAGALIQWLRDNLNLISNAEEIETLANSVDDNGDVYFVPAFSGLYAPYWKENARGAIVGLTRFNNKGHIARAALEASAYQTRDIVDAMLLDSGIELTELKVDGGMIANETLMQFQADVLGIPVIRPEVAETTALGAAYAAGLAVNFWQDTDELKDNWKFKQSWQPGTDPDARNKKYHRWQKAVTRTFDWTD